MSDSDINTVTATIELSIYNNEGTGDYTDESVWDYIEMYNNHYLTANVSQHYISDETANKIIKNIDTDNIKQFIKHTIFEDMNIEFNKIRFDNKFVTFTISKDELVKSDLFSDFEINTEPLTAKELLKYFYDYYITKANWIDGFGEGSDMDIYVKENNQVWAGPCHPYVKPEQIKENNIKYVYELLPCAIVYE